jgi:hypothetical protein
VDRRGAAAGRASEGEVSHRIRTDTRTSPLRRARARAQRRAGLVRC